jgi:lysophospholipase L1-like esterase
MVDGVRRTPMRRRLILLVVFGGLLIGLAAFYIQFFIARPIGSGPAGPTVQKEPFKKPWSERKVILLGIGDSITAGLGAKSKDHSYFNRLIANPSDEFDDMEGLCLMNVLPNLASKNIAVSGSTSLDHLEAIKTRLTPFPEEQFGIIVFTTGGNDLIHSYGRMPPKEGAMYGATLEQAKPWINAFEDRLQEMIECITSLFPGGCEIYLADIYDPTDGVGDAPSVYLPPWKDGLAIHARYNSILHECAERTENVHLVPLHKTFLGHGAHCRQFWRTHYDSKDPHYWFYSNIEDPNDRGYDAIRRIFLTTIVESTQLRLARE